LSDLIHIVCLDAPAPPNYGGAIDMYYKIISLSAAGKRIILHYFDYNPGRNAAGLEKYCAAIYTYKRKGFMASVSWREPYIVRSRVNQILIDRLNEDNHPILLEGIHCTGILPGLKNRERVIVRMHNEEASYYRRLAGAEQNPIRRSYLLFEAFLLKKYYRRLPRQIKLACLSQTDITVLKERYGLLRSTFIPCFIPWQSVEGIQGKGNYCLYHGNMKVAENEAAALWLVKHVFARMTTPFVIAGTGISTRLSSAVKNYRHISIVNNPSITEIDELIREAHINVLPSLNSTGVKLKVLHAVCTGRFCLVNRKAVAGSGIATGVMVAESPEDYIRLITELSGLPFSAEDKKNRQEILSVYDNFRNAEMLSAIW
jgi:hypothetical protein